MKHYRFPCGCEFAILEESPEPGVMPLLDFDIEAIPDSCPATWDMLARGDTKGVFQLESRLGRKWTKRLRPRSCEHMGALGALLRPGPLMGVDEEGVSMTEHYVRRKNGLEAPEAIDPAVAPILEKTYAVMTYQEQLMFAARDVAGFDLIGMDKLRKAVGKKDQAALAKVRDEFLAGAKAKGVVTEEKAQAIWAIIQKSGRYCFNKSHAICYGIRGYKTAYLKAHFPLAFFTAWLRNARSKPDPQQEVRELVNEARLFDITVEPPDLRDLKADVYTDRKVVRFGLANVKGVSRASVLKVRAAVAEAEAALGKKLGDCCWYEFLTEIAARMTPTVVTRFIQVGALSWLEVTRARLLAEYAAWESLTEKERDWVRSRRTQFGDLVTALAALSLPRYRKPVTTTTRHARWGHEDAVADLELAYGELLTQPDTPERKTAIAENRKQFRRYTTVERRTPPEPVGPFGGCSSDERESAVRSVLRLLREPPSPLVDAPFKIANEEQELLGIALTCSAIDSCDISAANCTCKEFRCGRTGTLYLAVKIEQVLLTKTKSGKNPGAAMARLVVADSTASVEAVVFPEAWKQYAHVLNEGNRVILCGERDRKGEYDSLVVQSAAQAI